MVRLHVSNYMFCYIMYVLNCFVILGFLLRIHHAPSDSSDCGGFQWQDLATHIRTELSRTTAALLVLASSCASWLGK